jgi:phosphotransferase system HPr-like phosphotransfer protein
MGLLQLLNSHKKMIELNAKGAEENSIQQLLKNIFRVVYRGIKARNDN